jgi:23S rRNA pseudouridine1911/1915/1917 synthase
LASADSRTAAVTLPEILFEDDCIVAFDKPCGLAVASGAPGAQASTLTGLARAAFGPSVSSVHRIDTEASGVVLFAGTKPALDFLSGQFQAKTVRRTFWALVSIPAKPRAPEMPVRDAAGALPGEFTVDLALGDDERNPGRVRPCRRGGRPSVTEFRILESFGRFVWLECRPLTGGLHQIRAHLACAGAPVLGDALYGDPGEVLLLSELKRRYKGRHEERPLVSRLALHSRALGFVHPSSREPVEITAPLPKELEVALKYLRRYPGAGRRPAGP